MHSPYEKGRATLTVRDPRLKSVLAGGIDGEDIGQTDLIGNSILRQVDAWARKSRGVPQYSFRREEPNSLGRKWGAK